MRTRWNSIWSNYPAWAVSNVTRSALHSNPSGTLHRNVLCCLESSSMKDYTQQSSLEQIGWCEQRENETKRFGQQIRSSQSDTETPKNGENFMCISIIIFRFVLCGIKKDGLVACCSCCVNDLNFLHAQLVVVFYSKTKGLQLSSRHPDSSHPQQLTRTGLCRDMIHFS